jgi:hypothetical protein
MKVMAMKEGKIIIYFPIKSERTEDGIAQLRPAKNQIYTRLLDNLTHCQIALKI